MNYKSILALSVLGFIATVLAYETAFFGVYSQFFSFTFYLIPPLLSVVIGSKTVGVFGTQTPKGRVFLFITLGLLAFFIGELIWFILEYYLQIDPFPSIADAFYLTGYPLLFYGLWIELQSSEIPAKKLISPLSVVVLLTVSVVLGYVRLASLTSSSGSAAADIIGLLYALGDILLIFICLFILKISQAYTGGIYSIAWKLFLAGLLATMAGDVLFAMFTGPYSEGMLSYLRIDYLWLLGYLAFSYSLYRAANVPIAMERRLYNKV